MSSSDDEGGWLVVIGLGVAIYFGYHWWNKEPDAVPQPTLAQVPRPIGLIPLTSLKEGTTWSLNASSVKGDRQHRLAWVLDPFETCYKLCIGFFITRPNTARSHCPSFCSGEFDQPLEMQLNLDAKAICRFHDR